MKTLWRPTYSQRRLPVSFRRKSPLSPQRFTASPQQVLSCQNEAIVVDVCHPRSLLARYIYDFSPWIEICQLCAPRKGQFIYLSRTCVTFTLFLDNCWMLRCSLCILIFYMLSAVQSFQTLQKEVVSLDVMLLLVKRYEWRRLHYIHSVWSWDEVFSKHFSASISCSMKCLCMSGANAVCF